MGATPDGPPPAAAMTVRLDRPADPPAGPSERWRTGATLPVGGPLPAGLPPGYHHLQPDDGPGPDVDRQPRAVPAPAELRPGGSRPSSTPPGRRAAGGSGDLDDLKELGAWSGVARCRVRAGQPAACGQPHLAAAAEPVLPGEPVLPEPPLSGGRSDPGRSARPGIADLARAGRALNEARLIDRDQVWELKSRALEAGFADFRRRPRLRCLPGGSGPSRSSASPPSVPWPSAMAARGRPGRAEWRDPTSPSVREFAASPVGSARVRYYAWLQWQLDRQLAAAGRLPSRRVRPGRRR